MQDEIHKMQNRNDKKGLHQCAKLHDWVGVVIVVVVIFVIVTGGKQSQILLRKMQSKNDKKGLRQCAKLDDL